MSENSELELTGTELLAAEYAVGLLHGEDFLAARSRLARDPAFAARVDFWETKLAPMLDDAGAAEPSEEFWGRVERAIDSREEQGGSAEIIDLQARLTRWKWTAGLTSAAAAVALAFLALPTGQAPGTAAPVETAAPAGATLVANVPIEGTPLSIDLTYMPEKASLLVAAADLTHDGVHDHELWLVMPEGGVESLGVVTPGEIRSHNVPASYAADMTAGAQLLLTREPLGGKPANLDAGPVVASGEFTTI